MTKKKASGKTRKKTVKKKVVKKTSGKKRKKPAKKKTPPQPIGGVQEHESESGTVTTALDSNGQATDEIVYTVGPEDGKGSRRVTARLSEDRFDDNFDVLAAKGRNLFFDTIADHFHVEERDQLNRYHGVLVELAEEADDIVEQAAADASGDESGDGGGGKNLRPLSWSNWPPKPNCFTRPVATHTPQSK